MKRWLIATVGSLAFLDSTCAALAQDTATGGGGGVFLVEAQSHERTAEGQLDACEMTYTVAFEDHIYRRGAISYLRGAVSVMGLVNAKDKPPAMTVKVTAFDLVDQKVNFAPLGYAYLTAAGQSFAKKEFVNFTCDDGGLCFGYEILKYPELWDIFQSTFEINFNRANGSSDVKVPISILRDKPTEAANFSHCMVKLLDAVQQKFRK